MMLHFAGGEAWGNLLMDMGVRNQLMSYYYFRERFAKKGSGARELIARMRRAQNKGYRFMLDSGAFTYQASQKKAGHLPPPSVYFKEYKQFVAEYGDIFHIIVEFDVDGYTRDEDGRIIETARVDSWTNELLQIGGDICDKIMPVFHSHRGEGWLEDWLLDTGSPLVGIGSTVGHPAALIQKAHRFGKFVHGFAQTRIKTDMKYTPFDSVDSTSWLRGDQFGATYVFQGGQVTILDSNHKADRRNHKAYFESWGLDWAKLAKDDLHENRLATIIAWRELANHLEKQWYIRTGGKHPYLYEAVRRGEVYEEHPLITHKRRQHAGQ